MGYFDNEMGEMLDVYLMETGQLLEQADAILMSAEKTGQLSAEDINGIFRIMHTTKSSSAMMGLDDLSGLAHRLEDVFSEFREDPAKLNGIEREAFNLIFDVTGFIRSELDRMGDEDYAPAKADALIEKIEGLVSRLKKNRTLAVNLRFEKNCRMEHVRAFMVARQIQGLCGNIRTYPEDVETNPATADFIREHGFYLSFSTDEPENVLKRLSRALFVESCQVVEEMPDRQIGPESGAESFGDPDRAQGSGEERTREETSEKTDAAGQVSVPFRSEGNFISVKLERLDQLQSVTEELLIAAASFRGREKEFKSGPESSANRQMARCLKELKDLVASIRMVPFSGFVPKLNRIVRDMCQKEHKEVVFTVTGQELEVDKAITDSMMEPLLHLIRNAVDHGIESCGLREKLGKSRAGHVNLRFANLGGEISVTIEDDGVGMDTEKIRKKAEERGLLTKPVSEYTRRELLELCLLPGFSTCDSASEFSGRGVGMDVVAQTVERLGGHIRLESEPGRGSRIRLTLPLTLTIIDGIRFRTGEYSFAAPSYQVRQFFSCEEEAKRIVSQDGRPFWVHEGRYIPVIFLAQFYGIERTAERPKEIMAYVKGVEREACLVIDQVMEQGNIVEKALPGLFGKRFKRKTGISGCSILGDGSACMLLDVESLIRAYMRGDSGTAAAFGEAAVSGGGENSGESGRPDMKKEERGAQPGEDGETEVLCVERADSYYGVELPNVSEILDGVKISGLPCLPEWYEGICSYKGALLPVLAFNRLLGSDREEETGGHRVVAAMKAGEYECGFLTGQRPELIRLTEQERLEGELPESLGGGVRVKSMYSYKGKLLVVVDVEETLKGLVVCR